MVDAAHIDIAAVKPPQAARLPVISDETTAPLPTLSRMFARLDNLCEFDAEQIEHLATFSTTRALVTLTQGATQERRMLGHLMPDFYERAIALVGAGHITATIEQEGREPFAFAFETQEPADEIDAAEEVTPRAAPRQDAAPPMDALALLLAEMRADRKAAQEREERREREREIERREERARQDAQARQVDPFTDALRNKAQELQLKMMDKAARALDEATAPEKKQDELDMAVNVIERLANVKQRADDALSRIATAPAEALKEPDLVDMFERVSANPLAQEVARKFFKLDAAAPLAPKPATLPAPDANEPPPVNDTPNPFSQDTPGAAVNA
jgi:hypothetical protein